MFKKKKAQGANMGRVSEQIRAECGKRGDGMASCNRRPFYLACNGGRKWRMVAWTVAARPRK